MFAALLLLTGLAFAQDDAEVDPVPSEAPSVEEPAEPGHLAVPDNAKPLTVPVYRGTEIRFMDENGVELSEAFRLGFQAYLVPEYQFDQLLAARENLSVCQTALSTCQSMSRAALTDAQSYYQIARDQFQSDQARVAELTTQVTELEYDLAREQSKNQRLRTQRNVAWAITGGLVLGAVSVTAVAIGN